MSGTYSKGVLTIFENGTLLLGYHTSLTWVPVDPPARDERLALGDERAHVLRAWPDGLLLQPYRLNETSDVYFVPIGEDSLDFSGKLRLADDESVWCGSRQFARNGHLLVWLNNPDRELDSERICLYNLKTDEKQAFPFQVRQVELQGFDGTIAVVRQWNDFIVFDTVRGQRLGVTRFRAPLAEEDGFRYYIFRDRVPVGPARLMRERYKIVVVDLTSEAHDTQVLREVVLTSGSPRPKILESGIEIWNGEERILVPWAKRQEL
jgi:hypothetical protein